MAAAVEFIKQHKMTSLFSASVIVQLSVLLAGLYFLSGVSTPVQTTSFEASKDIDIRASLAVDKIERAARDPLSKNELAKKKPAVSADSKSAKPANKKAATNRIKLSEYKVRSGDTLTSIWNKNGGTYAGAIAASKAFKAAGVSLNTLRPGETLKLKVEDGEIQRLNKTLSGARTLVLTRKSDGTYAQKINEPNVVEAEKKVSGVILHSFAESAHRVSLPPELVDDFVDLFAARVEFSRNIQPGDVFTVVYSERMTERGKKLEAGPIVAASLENSGSLMAAVQHVDRDGESRFYDEDGEPLGNFFLRYPLRFTRISSQFTKSRFHPVLKRHRPHNGVDFAAPIGTPVRSVADGIIQKSGWAGGAGRMVKIKHSSRWSTAYMHLNSIAKGVRPGTRIKRGQLIGTVGKTGLATGAHLHFSMYDHGRYVDPMKTKLPKMPQEKEVIPNDLLRAKLEMLEKAHETLHLASSEFRPSVG